MMNAELKRLERSCKYRSSSHGITEHLPYGQSDKLENTYCLINLVTRSAPQ
jgi:hypothetical protein